MDLIHEPAYLTVVNLSIWQLQVQISKLEKLFPISQALERPKKGQSNSHTTSLCYFLIFRKTSSCGYFIPQANCIFLQNA